MSTIQDILDAHNMVTGIINGRLVAFYDYMLERGEVDREAVKDMKARIKEELPEWLKTMKRYDDPSIDPEDVWQW